MKLEKKDYRNLVEEVKQQGAFQKKIHYQKKNDILAFDIEWTYEGFIIKNEECFNIETLDSALCNFDETILLGMLEKQVGNHLLNDQKIEQAYTVQQAG